MNQLPLGVYAVSAAFDTDTVTFTFRDRTYTATLGQNAFSTMEALSKANLCAPAEPIFGYGGQPVILVPAGTLPIGDAGKTREERFRVTFPQAVTILGENVGISPNSADLRTAAPRRPESVIRGSYYFGSLCLSGNTDGMLIIDGITLGCRAQDLRTGGENAGLTVKNSILDPLISAHIIWATGAFSGSRTVTVTDCRADGLKDMNGEGNLLYVGAGHGVMERVYITNTGKFPGMAGYARTQAPGLDTLTLRDCIFENGCALRGLTLRLTEDSHARLCLENCEFLRFTVPGEPAIWVSIPDTAALKLTGCRFAGSGRAAIELTGNATLTDCHAEGYDALIAPTPPRQTVPDPGAVYPIDDPHSPIPNADFTPLDALYAGRACYHGDFHCHSNSGGTSDGKTPLAQYVPDMQKLAMDFAAIVDHGQMRHFFLPEWDETYLICGTEPGCLLNEPDRPAHGCKLDYTMIFPDNTGLAQVMEAFPQFRYTGGIEGHYIYPRHTVADLTGLSEFIYGIGGLLSHAHPKQLMVSDDPLDYYFGEHAAIETIHVDASTLATRLNRDLWIALLNLGKQVRTHGSSDSHGKVSNRGLTTVYAPRHHSKDIFQLVRAGDCTAGAAGIRMCIDGAPMGSVTDFAPGKTLYLRISDFHRDHRQPDTVYSLRLYTDRGLAWATQFDGRDMALAFPVADRAYYRAEIWNESDGHVFALSNPIFAAGSAH